MNFGSTCERTYSLRGNRPEPPSSSSSSSAFLNIVNPDPKSSKGGKVMVLVLSLKSILPVGSLSQRDSEAGRISDFVLGEKGMNGGVSVLNNR